MMTAMSNVWIDGDDLLAITGNQHAPDRYSKLY